MDNLNLLLCDELLLEILRRLPSSSNSTYSISLVCKRWLSLHRSSKTILSVRLPPNHNNNNNSVSFPSFSTLLSRYPSLSALTVIPDASSTVDHDPDSLLLSIISNCRNLRHLRFLAGPTSPSALCSLAASCRHLTSLSISSSPPLFFFRWVTSFPFLKELSVVDDCRSGRRTGPDVYNGGEDDEDGEFTELPLESLCLSGIRAGDLGMGWLWRSCTRLRRLQLRSCQGTGDGPAFASFVRCLHGLHELDLRTCRSIADGVLLRLAEHCASLTSLLLYDGGSRDGLHWFITHCRPTLRRVDLRLPLDLDDHHLSAIAENFRGLSSLRLQSCCLVTGHGLKLLGPALSNGLEELVLINCDVVEREPGLLTSLGQNLRQLRKLDLSYNDMLLDKELGSMLPSCKDLVDVRLRGCGALTGAALVSMLQCCKLLESVDITQCRGIGVGAVEMFLLKSSRLNRILIEECKLSNAAKECALRKVIQFG
ncbi:F-box/LRR-repeat protein 4 [Magnolia sinica]|uniref:F-box/LRR-repeat protein 4 n=1 Tax=Magnolia sinica TaxID=86752 RepID=UPI00265A4429|nr:F-box/LRR-repeat protein 4 [Magnolia sinica]XP_058093653.1 F-box/LRR-repeat protein 4 [Magnolia sinica]